MNGRLPGRWKKLTDSAAVSAMRSNAGAPDEVSPLSSRSSTCWFSVSPGVSAPRVRAALSASLLPALTAPIASTRLRAP